MIGLLIPLSYVTVQLLFLWAFRKSTLAIETSLRSDLDTLTSSRSPSQGGDEVVAILRFSHTRKKAIWYFCLALIVLFFGMSLILGLFIPLSKPNLEARIGESILIFSVGCGGAPWLLLIEPYGNMRVVTRKGMLKKSPWTGTAFVNWDEMTSVIWLPIINNFIVRSTRGTFAVSPVYENLEAFAHGVMNNLPSTRWRRAKSKLTRATAGPFQP